MNLALIAAIQSLDYVEIPATLAGMTYGPGVYRSAAAFSLVTDLILDAHNQPNAQFVFVTDGAFNTTAGAKIILINGAQAINVFWVSTGALTSGAGSLIAGNFLSQAAITLGADTVVHGYLFAVAAITVASSVEIIPAQDLQTRWLDITLGTATAGTEYSDFVSAVGVRDGIPESSTACIFTVDSGALPTGLILETTTGYIRGVATDTGTFTFAIDAQAINFEKTSGVFSLTVIAALEIPVVAVIPPEIAPESIPVVPPVIAPRSIEAPSAPITDHPVVIAQPATIPIEIPDLVIEIPTPEVATPIVEEVPVLPVVEIAEVLPEVIVPVDVIKPRLISIIYFTRSTSSLDHNAYLALAKFLQEVGTLELHTFELRGFSDKSKGLNNYSLSLARAKAVNTFFIAKKIKGKKIILSFSSQQSQSSTRSSDPQDRRVEIWAS